MASEATMASRARTDKYDIFAKTYISVTNGIEIYMARGRLLENHR